MYVNGICQKGSQHIKSHKYVNNNPRMSIIIKVVVIVAAINM